MVVVVPFTVKLPVNVPSTAVTFPVAARLPVTLAPVDIACIYTARLCTSITKSAVPPRIKSASPVI